MLKKILTDLVAGKATFEDLADDYLETMFHFDDDIDDQEEKELFKEIFLHGMLAMAHVAYTVKGPADLDRLAKKLQEFCRLEKKARRLM
jgi:hypothetical protein